MKSLMLALMLTVGCGGKKQAAADAAAAEAAAAAAAKAEAEAAAAQAEPEPEPEPEPPPEVINADIQVTLNFADGTSHSGKVKRIERSDSYDAEGGWLTEDRRIQLEGESGSTLKEYPWSEVKSISVTAGKIPGDVDCTYSTETNPWTYQCALKTTAKMTTTDGQSWTVSTGYKWRLVFDDDSQYEFWLKKYRAVQQDTTKVDLDTVDPENLDMYIQLQDQLRKDIKSEAFVTGITVN